MDNNGQLTFDDTPLKKKYREGLFYIQKGEMFKALEIMENILESGTNVPGIIDSVKAVKFWTNRWTRILKLEAGYKRAQLLINEWSNFERFLKEYNITFEEIIINLKNYIFKKIIKNLIIAFQSSDVPDIDILIKIGEIFLEIDEIDKSIETFEYARVYQKHNSLILSLLADGYYRKGNIKHSKLLFREAFLYLPEKIRIELIKADFILVLYKKVSAIFGERKLILYWLPVYGEIYNVLNVKREIEKKEIENLIIEVENLEREYETKHFSNKDLEPKLINRYFWIIDYYKLQNNNDEYANIFIDKLKNLNNEIYEIYINKDKEIEVE